ncbi:SH3 domain-containing protein [Exiguobacterium acetylicum]
MNTTSISKPLKVFASLLIVFSIILSSLPIVNAATTKATTYRLSADTDLYDKTTSSRKRLLTIKTGTIVSSAYDAGSYKKVTYGGKTGYVASKYLVLYEKKQAISGQRYIVSTNTAIKNAARTTATTIGTLQNKDVYYTTQRVTDPYGKTWYRLNYAGKTGYVPSGATPVSYQNIKNETLRTTDTYTLRTYAGTGYPKIQSIPSGTNVEVVGKINEWYSVRYGKNSGYMHRDAFLQVSKQSIQTIPTARFLLKKSVEIKASASSTSKTIASLKTGDAYYTTTLATDSRGGTWHKIKKDGQTGYILANQGTSVNYESLTNMSFVTTAKTTIRSYAGSSYAGIKSIPAGAKPLVSGRIGAWYRVSYDGVTGYASAATFKTAAIVQKISGTRFAVTSSTDVLVAPEADAFKVATLQEGDIYYTTRLITLGSKKWYQITKDGKTGYIAYGSGEKVIYQADSVTMKTTNATGLKSYAGVSYASVKSIPSGTKVSVTGSINEWYRVTYEGKTGYVHQEDLNEYIVTSTISPARYVLNTSIDVKTTYQTDADTWKTLKNGDVYYTTRLVTNGHGQSWHRISVDGKTGYIRANQGNPISYSKISAHRYKTVQTTSLKSYAGPTYSEVSSLAKGTVVQVNGTIGTWTNVSVNGKTGYIDGSYLTPYTETKKISGARFLANENLIIRNSPLEEATTLTTLAKGNVYYTTSLITSHTNKQWHKVTINGKTGYVDTKASTSKIDYISKDSLYVRATSATPLRSYVGSSYQVVTTIPSNVVVNVTGQIGQWYKISYQGKSGYAYNGTLVTTSSKLNVYNSIATPYTFDTFISTQMKLNPSPQTDLYKNKMMYVSSMYVRFGGSEDPVNGTLATVSSTTPLNIRSGAATDSHIYGQFQPKQMIKVYQRIGDFYTTYPRVYTSSTGYWTLGWLNALESDVRNVADPLKVSRSSKEFFQFLDLSKTTGASAATLDKIISTKGIFGKCTTGSCGQAFIDAGTAYSVNEIYLISHALLETGNGTSTLANGVIWNGKMVYNMYGIGAVDSDPINGGARTAYEKGWFTPEAAIMGGAEFIGTQYIHHAYNQNTLYKMRWNPMNPGRHQYATDMGWAAKQTTRIYDLYQQMDSYTAVFDIPVFAR